MRAKAAGALLDTPEMKTLWPVFRAERAAGAERGPIPGMASPRFRRDQGKTPTCVGCGVGATAAIFLETEYGYDGLWSFRALFTLAKEWAKQDRALSYEGTFSSAAWSVLQTLGLVEEADWPMRLGANGFPLEDDWYKDVTVGTFTSMGPHLLPHRLTTSEECRAWVEGMGKPFSFVAPADESYELLTAGEVWKGPKGDAGLHCQCVHGSAGDAGAIVLSSWGDGDRIIDWGCFGDGTCSDMIGPIHG